VMNHCPHRNGFYLKMVRSYLQFYDWNGRAVAAEDTRSAVGRGGTIAYCEDCNAALGRYSELSEIKSRVFSEKHKGA